jgi:hypothetical protein
MRGASIQIFLYSCASFSSTSILLLAEIHVRMFYSAPQFEQVYICSAIPRAEQIHVPPSPVIGIGPI